MVYCCSYTIHVVTVYSTGNVIYRDGNFVISTFLCMCALPTIAFCGALISCFPIKLLKYFMNDFVIFPVAPIITGISFVFVLQIHCISIVRSWYFKIFSYSFLITLLAPEIAVPFLLLLLLYDMDVSCQRPFLSGTSLEPAVIPTTQASSFTLIIIIINTY